MVLIKKNVLIKLGIVMEMIFCCTLNNGCVETVQRESPDKSLINAEIINTLNDIAMQNAIVSQHTLFPYHFVKNGEKLNQLGQRDLTVLAKHLEENPGNLNIRRNNISKEPYQARVTFVIDKLKEAGVEVERISVSDGMPGGPGMASEKILTILERQEKATAAARTGAADTTLSTRTRGKR